MRGLELSAIPFGDLAPEDRRELGGLADGAVGIKKALAQSIQCGAAMEDQVVTVFDLGQKQAMLTGGLAAFGGREEGGEGAEPLLGAALEITWREGIGELL